MDYRGYHTEYGLHSNIPKCCVEFWCKEINAILDSSSLRAEYDMLQAAAEKKINKIYNYRPCRKCMQKGYWQRLHRCKGECADMFLRLQIKYGITPAPFRRLYV